ncbi:MAG: Rieske 2Fe-2S domain-containing protein [Gammaproteobacteria bacterium]|nr:Rieske 2Fe-2S domain-containing protein [Gammaproteobacteria bacterium]
MGKPSAFSEQPALAIKEGRNEVRQQGINPDFWYPVGWADDYKPGRIHGVEIWLHRIAVYRDRSGKLGALENACLHKGVELHKGTVEQNCVTCPYHGWQFNASGECIRIPYLPEGQPCPASTIRSFPVKEKYGIIWVFPGDVNKAKAVSLPEVKEYDNSDYLMIKIPGRFFAHFSICNENAMDVFHGHLHTGLEGWFNPILVKLDRQDDRITAEYQVSYKGRMAKFLGLAETATKVEHRCMDIEYHYPHYRSTMSTLSSFYLLCQPIGPKETRSYSLLFLKPNLPQWIWLPVRGLFSMLLRKRFKRFQDQDKEMMESEQPNYDTDPTANRVEFNPAIVALRQLMAKQADLSDGSK